MDTFLESITSQLDQPLLPQPMPQPELLDEDLIQEHTQRKSTRLAKKASSRVGKDTMKLAQDLLSKKLGELTPESTSNREANFESFSQHLDKPLNNTEMEALQDLVDHGIKLEKKAGKNKSVTKKMAMA